jgi:hypothetical protein
MNLHPDTYSERLQLAAQLRRDEQAQINRYAYEHTTFNAYEQTDHDAWVNELNEE